MEKKSWSILICLLFSFCGYLYFGYGSHREDFLQLASTFVLLFAVSLFLIRGNNERNEKILLAAAIVFRLLFLFSIPALSDDYFRFLWDGMMMTLGQNAFAVTPAHFLSQTENPTVYMMQLYSGMNSQNYFTVYPPVCQYVFALAYWLSPNNMFGGVLVMHTVCIGADVGNIFLLRKFLKRLQLPKENLWWYALNPLVIIELSGNLHFESLMIFFLLMSIYFLFHTQDDFQNEVKRFSVKNIFLRGMRYALAVCTKLIPLLFLPFFFRRMKWKQSLLFYSAVFAMCVFLFLPFVFNKELLNNLGSSINLYFQTFEFNASIFYLIRWVGFQMVGYDVIHQVGPWLAICVFILVITLAIREKRLTIQSLFRMMQWSLLIYFLFATTVHPWYLSTLIMLSVFTGFRFPIVWSLFVILSYATYQQKPYHENLWFTAIEYGTLLIAIIADLRREKQIVNS